MGNLMDGEGFVKVTPPRGRTSGTRDFDPEQSGADRAAARGNQKLSALLNAIDSVELHDQHDVHDFLEGLRRLGHYVSVQAHLGGAELEAGAKQQAKDEATLGIVGFNMRSRIRSVTKPIDSCANHFAAGAADAVKAWHAMEKLLDELHPKSQVKKPRGFAFDLS